MKMFLMLAVSGESSFTSSLVFARVKSLIPVYLLPTQACSPKLECFIMGAPTAKFSHLHCKKILGPKSSQDPDRRALHGYSWISIRGILILIFSGNISGKNKDGRKNTYYIVFCADHNGSIRLKKQENFPDILRNQIRKFTGSTDPDLFGLFSRYCWK